MAKHGADCRFVSEVAAVRKPARRRTRRSVGPKISVQHVDARMAGLEDAITHTTATLRDAVSQGLTQQLKLQGETVDALNGVTEAVARLPHQSAVQLVAELDRRLTEGCKVLHRHVRVIVDDSNGVRISEQNFELDRDEQLDVTVHGTKVTASQSQTASAR